MRKHCAINAPEVGRSEKETLNAAFLPSNQIQQEIK